MAKAEEMHETLVDVCVMLAHESNMSTDLISDSKVTYEIPFQPFAADQLSGQFPRPTQLTPRKSSAIKESTIQKVTDVSDDDEEKLTLVMSKWSLIRKRQSQMTWQERVQGSSQRC